jgi:hypothetical protein
MPRCGAPFDENSVPLGQGETSGGERGNKPPCASRPLSLRATPPREGISGERLLSLDDG